MIAPAVRIHHRRPMSAQDGLVDPTRSRQIEYFGSTSASLRPIARGGIILGAPPAT